MLYGYPLDAVVLTIGCDKTTPACLMAAATVDIPAIALSSGPMLNGWYKGQRTGSGTIVWMAREKLATGELDYEGFIELVATSAPSTGFCHTMGTATTMNSLAEALGMTLPGNAAIPAVDARRRVICQMSGRRIVDMVKEDLKPSDILTKQAFENSIRTNGAIGGSTNAVLHILALAGRVGVDLTLDDWDRLGRDVPTIVNLQPSGKHLMEEFYYAGGLPVVMKQIAEMGLLHKDAITVTGEAMWEGLKDSVNYNDDVIVPQEKALTASGGIAVLRGNLAPQGAVLKPSAASPSLMKHRGRAVVFESIEDYHERVNLPDLDIDETCIMVLKYCGPKGYPGMAEVGNMGLPSKVLKKGITDMIRISDARMSGTAYGTVILHVAPEAADGGPLALVQNGDMIDVDIPARTLHLDVSAEELANRRAAWVSPIAPINGGYGGHYVKTVLQADRGADLDFLVGSRGSGVYSGRDSH